MASSGQEPAFFQVLVGDFSEKMKIPRAFVNHLNGPALCKLQGSCGKSWSVKLEERNNDYFFHTGWKKFVKDNFLDEGDFLIFNYDGDSRFNVTIYDESACEMDMEAAKTKRTGNGQRRDYVPPAETRIIEFNTRYFCFKRTLEKHRLYQMTIPKVIAMAKLQMSKQTIELQDPSKTSWPVTVTPMPDGRLLMHNGWRDCCKANQIKEGHTIVFEFVKEHVKLHIFRAEGCDVILTGPNVVDQKYCHCRCKTVFNCCDQWDCDRSIE